MGHILDGYLWLECHFALESLCHMPAIHTEAQFEDEVCQALKAQGWLLDGPLPRKGFCLRPRLRPPHAPYLRMRSPGKGHSTHAWERFIKNHTKEPQASVIPSGWRKNWKMMPDHQEGDPAASGHARRAAQGLQGHQRHIQDGGVRAQQPAELHHLEHYKKNRLRVVRQLHYSLHNQLCIDLVLFLNGSAAGHD